RSTPAPTPDNAQQSAIHRSCPRDTPPQPNILPQPTNSFVSPNEHFGDASIARIDGRPASAMPHERSFRP
ncbi:MAG: hypothetical protein WBP81_27930, partial [Solirubrobacteraceae bacterium]